MRDYLESVAVLLGRDSGGGGGFRRREDPDESGGPDELRWIEQCCRRLWGSMGGAGSVVVLHFVVAAVAGGRGRCRGLLMGRVRGRFWGHAAQR